MNFKNQLLNYVFSGSLLLSLVLLTTFIHPKCNFQIQAVAEHTMDSSTQSKQAQLIQDESTAPDLVVVLMVKNEEHVIVPTLQPYVEGGVKHILVYDTGSTDTTVQKAENYFKDNNLNNAYVVREEHDAATFDFAKARNRGLEIAEEKFPAAGFILMPDAEWYLQNTPELIAFCKEHTKSNLHIPYYIMRIGNAHSNFYTPRLFRCSHKVRFEGDIHEVPNIVSTSRVPEHINFILSNTTRGIEKSKARWVRDEVKLRKRYENNPQDPRAAFYLAQTYECLGDIENAQKYYKLRFALPGWDEENYMSLYRLANMTEILESKEEKTDYKQTLEYYSQAFALRPQRIEPLIKMGQIYWKLGNFTFAYAMARAAFDKPYPIHETLCVEDHMYNFERYELMSKSAYWAKEYKLGEIASRKIIELSPEEPQWKTNLSAYLFAQYIATQSK